MIRKVTTKHYETPTEKETRLRESAGIIPLRNFSVPRYDISPSVFFYHDCGKTAIASDVKEVGISGVWGFVDSMESLLTGSADHYIFILPTLLNFIYEIFNGTFDMEHGTQVEWIVKKELAKLGMHDYNEVLHRSPAYQSVKELAEKREGVFEWLISTGDEE